MIEELTADGTGPVFVLFLIELIQTFADEGRDSAS
jgi:hypothetical protein